LGSDQRTSTGQREKELAMDPSLRVLHLEDDPKDTELVQAALEAEGIQAELTRVETKERFGAALKQRTFDLILADYTLPSFDGLSALSIAQHDAPDIPFIFVSGTLGEDIAIEALKTGATDYVLKTRLGRLGPSVTRALREAREKSERKQTQERLNREQQRFMGLVNSVDGIVWEADAATFACSFVSEQAKRILGYPTERWLREPTFWKDHLHPEDREWAVQFCAKATAEKRNHDFEYRMIGADGRTVWLHDVVTVVIEGDRPTILRGVMVDTTARKRAEEAVRKSEEQLRDLIETIPAMAFVTQPDGSNEFVSRQWIEFSGLSQEKSAGGGWAVTLHPEDSEQHVAKWNAAQATGQPFESVARHRDANGKYRWLLVRAVPSRDEEGNILKWYGALTDIEDRKRAEALLAGENRILEMVAKGDSLSEILNSLCRLVEEQASDVLASILLVQDGRLRHGGAPDLPDAYIEAIDGTAIGPIAGSCGTAAYTGKQVIVEDIATDPLWVDYRDTALLHSLRACWSTPIFSTEGKVIGTFAMYYREPRRPTERDQEIIEQITHLAGIAIERKLTQDKLSLSERNLTEAQKLTHTGSFVWDIPSKNALYLSDEWYRIYGFEIGDPRAWEERVNRLGPEETKQWEEAVARAIEQKSDYEIEKHIVLPDGTRKSLHAIGHPVLNSSGEVVQFIGTVTDITERKRAEEQLRGSEARFRTFVDHATDAFMLFGEDKTVVDVNRQACEALGYTREELIGMKPTEFDPDADPSFLKGVIERIDSGEVVTFESRHRRKDGTVFPVEVRARLFWDGGRKFSLALVRDASERKRAEALLAGEKHLLEMIATGVPLKEILNALCQIIEEQRPGTLASVLLMNRDGIHLDVAAGPNLPRAWTRQMELLPIGPCAGSCGTAAYRGSPVIVSDIATDPLWDVTEHRAAALKHGLRASWSNPVLSWKGDVLGTFCMYYQERRAPTSKDLALIELATHLVRVAIERDRTQEALRASERVARSHVEVMMRSLDVLATESAPEKFIAEMLRTIGQHLRALRVVLFLRNPQDDTVRMHLVIEDDRQVAVHSDHPFAKDPSAWKKRPLFQELLFTKSPVVVDDIEGDARVEPEFREYLKRHRCQRFMGVPMFVSGTLRGFIGIHHSEKGSYRADEIELAQALAHHVMMAAHGQELVEQQREAAILKERTRMARDIHDTLAQGFTGVIIQMEAAEEAFLERDPAHAVDHVRRARELARDSLGEARRSVHALRPQALEKAAFVDALQAIVTNTAAGTALQTEFQVIGKPHGLSPAVEENLLHIGQEALTNALKHAHATKFNARISFDSDAVYLELHDNGDGFDVDGINGGGIGLIGMKERADQIGATVNVTSEPGKGTKITAVSPYQSA
jgi:PAS domain S-box-containing protein